MSKIATINWKEFKETLLLNSELDLQFQYAENKWVDAPYHITEIKQAPIVSVDCGGVMNSWTEIIIQLWEPQDQQQLRAMKVKKALSIIEVVENKLALDPLGTVKIEFGNSEFDTRQMFPNKINIIGENLVIDLMPDAVQCKAINRGGSCDIVVDNDNCCAPATKKPEIKLNYLTTASCTPGSGCC